MFIVAWPDFFLWFDRKNYNDTFTGLLNIKRYYSVRKAVATKPCMIWKHAFWLYHQVDTCLIKKKPANKNWNTASERFKNVFISFWLSLNCNLIRDKRKKVAMHFDEWVSISLSFLIAFTGLYTHWPLWPFKLINFEQKKGANFEIVLIYNW